MNQDTDQHRISYDRLAETYAQHIAHELEQKPLDRSLLDRFAQKMHKKRLVYDIGCGPGHITRYLWKRGVPIQGIDLSPRMAELAHRFNPQIEFQVGDMAALKIEDATVDGIVAFYSIIHIPRLLVPAVLREFKRVLRPGGLLLLSFHKGQEIRHFDELWGQPISLDFIFFERTEMERYVREAGLTLEESIEREPYVPDVEVQTRRVYLFARKPFSRGA